VVHTKYLGQVLAIIKQHVPAEEIRPLLRDLAQTEAYARNKSFRETIEALRLVEQQQKG
jgi:hypothetical protein